MSYYYNNYNTYECALYEVGASLSCGVPRTDLGMILEILALKRNNY